MLLESDTMRYPADWRASGITMEQLALLTPDTCAMNLLIHLLRQLAPYLKNKVFEKNMEFYISHPAPLENGGFIKFG